MLIVERESIVKEKENSHLIRRDLKGVRNLCVFAVVGFQFTLAQMPEPTEFTATVLFIVELLELCICGGDDFRRVEWRSRSLQRPERGTKNLHSEFNSVLPMALVLEPTLV